MWQWQLTCNMTCEMWNIHYNSVLYYLSIWPCIEANSNALRQVRNSIIMSSNKIHWLLYTSKTQYEHPCQNRGDMLIDDKSLFYSCSKFLFFEGKKCFLRIKKKERKKERTKKDNERTKETDKQAKKKGKKKWEREREDWLKTVWIIKAMAINE